MCPEVAISQRIHLWEDKSASHQPCESSTASSDRCGQEPWVSVALRGYTDVVTAVTFLEHVCPAVSCPSRNSRRPGPAWCRRSIGERRNWLFPLSHRAVQGCWMLPRSPGSHRQGMLCCYPSWHVDSWITNIETGVWERRDGRWCESRAWRFVDVSDLISCDVCTQPLSLWLLSRLIDQWPFQSLLNKRSKAVLPAQDCPS